MNLNDLPLPASIFFMALVMLFSHLLEQKKIALMHDEKTQINEQLLFQKYQEVNERLAGYEAQLALLRHENDELNKRIIILESKLIDLGFDKEEVKKWQK